MGEICLNFINYWGCYVYMYEGKWYDNFFLLENR